jgi:hypothetical protein
MDRLKILAEEVQKYAVAGFNLKTFYLCNLAEQVYAVVIIDSPLRKWPPALMILARAEQDYIIIEADITDKPLVEALIARGLSRESLILAYAGESLPFSEAESELAPA